jgi:hypothetical protein
VAELEQMVLAEANARQREERAASESEERLLARIAVLEAQKASLVNLEGELKRQQDSIASCFFKAFSRAVMGQIDDRVEELKKRRVP